MDLLVCLSNYHLFCVESPWCEASCTTHARTWIEYFPIAKNTRLPTHKQLHAEKSVFADNLTGIKEFSIDFSWKSCNFHYCIILPEYCHGIVPAILVFMNSIESISTLRREFFREFHEISLWIFINHRLMKVGPSWIPFDDAKKYKQNENRTINRRQAFWPCKGHSKQYG